jgi:hypothetical protein
MQLEAGKKYVDRRGRVYGPLVNDYSYFGESINECAWSGSGRVCSHCESDMDLVAEYAEPAPAESPDDWVIQDRVPARAEDKGWWITQNGSNLMPRCPSDMWAVQFDQYALGMMHDDVCPALELKLVVYCRRKDLPPVPPKTRTVVLKEWVCWDHEGEEHVRWQSYDPATQGETFEDCYSYSHATGNERTVEVPCGNP